MEIDINKQNANADQLFSLGIDPIDVNKILGER